MVVNNIGTHGDQDGQGDVFLVCLQHQGQIRISGVVVLQELAHGLPDALSLAGPLVDGLIQELSRFSSHSKSSATQLRLYLL